MDHDEATGGFAFNIEPMFFIKRLCHLIDFENLYSYILRFVAGRCDNQSKKFCPNPIPLVVRMNNDHSYERLTILVFNVGIPDKIMPFQYQCNPLEIKVGRKITALPLFIPTPYLGNKAPHYQAIQLIDRLSI